LVITLSEEESFLGIKIHDEEAHMNISKRILRFGVAALAMAIGSQALAAPIISESFEGTNGVGWASGTLVTNLPTSAWSSTGGDLSVITNMGDYGYTATSLPLTSDTHTNVVQLATEGGMLSFTNGASVGFGDLGSYPLEGPLYVDAMVRFVLSDSDPTESSITNDTKIAIFANSSSNLVIRHGFFVYSGEDRTFVLTNSVIDTTALLGAPIDPAFWYRLTVELSSSGDPDYFAQAQVKVNSNLVTHANAPGDLFLSAITSDTDTSLKAVSFQGTGFIDDVVVTRDVPTFGGTGSGFFYVIKEYTNDVFVIHHTVTAPAGWSKEYVNYPSSTWYTNKLGTNTTVGMFALGADNRTVTAPVPTGSENPTNILNVLLDQAKEAGELPEQFVDMTPADIAWIRSFGREPSDIIYTNANSLAFEQAMKLSPYAQETVTAQITSFTVGTSESTIVVKVFTNNVAYASANVTNLNIHIDSKASMTNEWPAAAGFTNPVTFFNVLGEATNTFITPSGFFRARILPQ
jgi:hypothetical protein